MANTQSKIDLLEEQNSKLLSEITEFKREKARLIAKEVGLMARIVELEQSAKENAELNARTEVPPTKDISPPIEDQSGKDNGITLDPMPEHNSTQTQRSESKSLTDPESSITSLPQDIIDDDTAETLDFVETVYKEQVSKEIMERIREKKLRDQELLSTPENNICCEQKTKEHLSQESPGSESPNHNIYVSEEPDEIEHTKSQCIEQGLTKQLRSNRDIVSPVSLEITEHQLSQVTTQRLVRLFQNAIRARHEEILSWYYYSDSFENKVMKFAVRLELQIKLIEHNYTRKC
ncbi:hypothetical protein Glove_413g23 [Diversispora epigaea]|uniref:Uncharacterized protein n=1 Tax=Diversispora epigaea TaxID=1348612 RepID=A0A397GXM0_9GLOM|nr:hypothetical protein Glove_413g23 [Diversispora epigaea]